MTDATTLLIYEAAERSLLNSWLRTLAAIRAWPCTYPTRWFVDRRDEEA